MSATSTPEIDIEELRSSRDAGIVVDVREPSEYAAGHVPGARLMPMGQLSDRLHELDTSAPVYVICAAGGRSSAMTDLLRASGFDAYSVAGGTAAWTRMGHPVEGGLA